MSGAKWAVHAIKTDGTAWAWGYNGRGCLGQNDRTHRSSPAQIPGTNWSDISSGMYNAGGIKTDGTLWMWGFNDKGQLGQNQANAQIGAVSSPVQVPGTSWSQIQVGEEYTIHATRTDGTLWVWGYNSTGELGQNNKTAYSSPVQIPGTWDSIKADGVGCVVAFKQA